MHKLHDEEELSNAEEYVSNDEEEEVNDKEQLSNDEGDQYNGIIIIVLPLCS